MAPPTGGVADVCDLAPLVEPLIGAVHDGASATDELPAADSCTFEGEHGSVSVVRDAGWSDLDAWIGWRHEPAPVDGLEDWALYEAPCSDELDDCECVTPDASVDIGAHDAVLT